MLPDTLGRAARATAVALIAAAVAAAVCAVAAIVRGPVVVDMNAELPRSVMSGFYPPERAGDMTFAWTSSRAELTLAGLPRDRAWSCAARLRAARRAPPHLDLAVDGLPAVSRNAPVDFEDVTFDIAPRNSRAETRLSLAVSPTIVPGPQDPRKLGVQVDRISCAPSNGRALPLPSRAHTAAVAIPAVFTAASALAGATPVAALTLGIAVAAAQMIPLNTGVAAFTPFTRTMTLLGLWIPAVALLLMQATATIRRQAFAPFTTFCMFAAAAALYLQLLGLLHPAKPPIDVVFQAHRFDTVLAGNYFFTQPMPGGVSFPYAIGLYLFALPWARLASDHTLLLRTVVCVSDAICYVVLYWLVMRVWRDRIAAALALVLAFTLPIAFEVIGNANLTNEFGHAASTAALSLAATLPGSRRRVLHAVLLTGVTTLALLSHVSTFALLAAMLTALSLLEWRAGDPQTRGAARIVLIVTVVSATLAFAGYYAHFMDVYRDALRVRTGAATSSAPSPVPADVRGQTAASLPMRIIDAVNRSVVWVGWPLGALGAVGGWRVLRERRRDPATLAAGACALAYVVFVGVSVMRVQPAYQRYTIEFVSRVVLATSPGLVLVAGAGASWGVRNGVAARIATVSLILLAVFLAGRHWIAWFH